MIHQLPPDVPMPLPQPTPVPPKEKDPIPEPLTVAPAPLPMPAVNVTAVPVSPAEHGKPAGAAPMLPLKTLPNVVVPPVRDYPERSRN